jgi:hypothetical protein
MWMLLLTQVRLSLSRTLEADKEQITKLDRLFTQGSKKLNMKAWAKLGFHCRKTFCRIFQTKSLMSSTEHMFWKSNSVLYRE